MDIRNLEARPKEIVSALREEYPKYDKFLHSKVCQPEKYAIKLVHRAERILKSRFKMCPATAVKADKHSRVHRITYRPENSQYEALQRAKTEDGYHSWQELYQALTDSYLKRRTEHV